MSEFDLIAGHFLRGAIRQPETRVANGDDASIHALADGHELVVSTDTAWLGIHWPKDFPLDDAMDRAVCAALSDLAAMGAKARWIWTAITLQHQDQALLMGQGIVRAADRHGVEIAGGDTTSGQQCGITVTVAGIIPEKTAMCRHQAHVGDHVFVLGSLGRSALGLAEWQKGKHDGDYVPYFTHITPQLFAGELLAKAGIRCCIDVSDGLLQDANHICEASHCAMRLDLNCLLDAFPSPKHREKDVLIQAVLTGGDDYALLFTAAPSMVIPEVAALRIGQCVAAKHGVYTSTPFLDNRPYLMDYPRGFDHFT
ncbi:MAG: thiamine-phosphate kinase [Mariprofundaceae bacterium]|nr:thiamine-phosphate kinase [Mariprofundaceae bacterium]